MAITKIGTIVEFQGSWQSGLGTLWFEGEGVLCENAPTVRALEGCFGEVIAAGHTVNQDAIRGQRVVYSVDAMGILIGFTPEEDWTGPEIPPEGLEDPDEEEQES